MRFDMRAEKSPRMGRSHRGQIGFESAGIHNQRRGRQILNFHNTCLPGLF